VHLPQLRRVRWAVRATLLLGVAASVVANILHAQDNPISQAIAAWPPLALLLTVELISRVPVHRRSLAAARLVATATIAGIAAWVSYWHMAGVAARYGETGASPYLLPLSVDGLIVVASICLVELAGRISSLERPAQPTFTDAPAAPAEPVVTIPAPRPSAAQPPAVHQTTSAQTTSAQTASAALAPGIAEEIADLLAKKPQPSPAAHRPAVAAHRPAPQRPAPAGRATPPGARIPELKPEATKQSRPAAKVRRSPAETVAEATRIRSGRPDITDSDLAAALGISTARWRTIRRETSDETLAA
jgi:hypothetical protein